MSCHVMLCQALRQPIGKIVSTSIFEKARTALAEAVSIRAALLKCLLPITENREDHGEDQDQVREDRIKLE